MTMPFGATLAAVAAVLIAAGCGGSEDPPDIPETATAGEPLSLTAREYLFTPNRITLRHARPRTTPVRQPIELRNQGELAHNIEVLDGDRIVGRLRSFPPGQERPLTVTLAPGEYSFVCTVADHDEKGMRGTIRVP
jgi:plastocyanin